MRWLLVGLILVGAIRPIVAALQPADWILAFLSVAIAQRSGAARSGRLTVFADGRR